MTNVYCLQSTVVDIVLEKERDLVCHDCLSVSPLLTIHPLLLPFQNEFHIMAVVALVWSAPLSSSSSSSLPGSESQEKQHPSVIPTCLSDSWHVMSRRDGKKLGGEMTMREEEDEKEWCACVGKKSASSWQWYHWIVRRENDRVTRHCAVGESEREMKHETEESIFPS